MAGIKKAALVTGGRRGIGLGIAKALANEGYDIAISAVSDEDAAKDALNEIQNAGGGKAIYCKADIGVYEARKDMVEKIKAEFGRLDVLVNNAGVAPKERADILEASDASFEYIIRTNLAGPYFLTQTVANWMIDQQNSDSDFQGCIININSVSAEVASVNRGDYCISKAGGAMATKLWAARLAEFGINVFEIRPGIIQTDMTSQVKGKYDKLIAEGLLLDSRWGKPEDIGKAVAMLARGDLPYATGQVLNQDGGMTLQRL